MKLAVRKYKKAARALRTFQQELLKSEWVKYNQDESDEKKQIRKDLFSHVNEAKRILNETIGVDALDALYWEGKELS